MYANQFKKNHNTVFESLDKSFYISYNDFDTAIYGSDTTALVLGQMVNFYILNGDHRKEYNALIESGLQSCLDYFQNHRDQKNKYSETLI